MTSIFNDISIPQTQAKPVQQSGGQQVAVRDAIPATDVKNDSVELSNKKEKKGPIKAVKGFIAGVKKFFASAGEYTKGLAKGITSGAVIGSVAYTGGQIINWTREKLIQRANANIADEAAKKVFKKIPNKLIAGILAAGAVGVNLWTASLNATQKQSEIDMRWTGIEPKK